MLGRGILGWADFGSVPGLPEATWAVALAVGSGNVSSNARIAGASG